MAEEIKDPAQLEQPEPVPEPATPPAQQAKTYSEDEYNALKSQIESLKKAAKDNEDFKKKFEESEQARKDFEHKTKISAYVKNLGLRDDVYEKHVENLILEKALKFDGDKLIGGDDVVNTFKGSHPDAFKPSGPPPKFVDKANPPAPSKDDETILRSVMGLD